MRTKKKVLIISVLCVVVLASVLGGFALASADDEVTPQELKISLMEEVAAIYEQNTGTAIDPAELQKAFTEANGAVRLEVRDQMLQKLVDDGKITQEQADAWKAWLDTRPATALTDDYKAWLESRPDIPEQFGFNNLGSGKSRMMPFGDRQSGMRGFGMGPGARGCFPDTNE